jgi:hypothetical protein
VVACWYLLRPCLEQVSPGASAGRARRLLPVRRAVNGLAWPPSGPAGRTSADLRAVRTGPGYECRNRYGAATGKLSGHAVGKTLDAVGFNTFPAEIRFSWTYAIWMPIIPMIGTRLSPFLQWKVIPSLAFWWARPRIGPAGRVETHDH